MRMMLVNMAYAAICLSYLWYGSYIFAMYRQYHT